MKYDFVVVSAGKNNIIADKNGNSYDMPKEFLQALPDKKYLKIGDIFYVITEKKLNATELSSTNNIICQGKIKLVLNGSLLEQGRTKKFLVSNVSYGSTLLTELDTGKDYVIFNSYVSECKISGINWYQVTEGNIVKFLLFDNMPVMPVPRKKQVLKKIKAPINRSFWEKFSHYTGASNGASANSSGFTFSSGAVESDSDSSGVVSDFDISELVSSSS